MAGHSKAEIVSALETAFDNKQLPDLENDIEQHLKDPDLGAESIAVAFNVTLCE